MHFLIICWQDDEADWDEGVPEDAGQQGHREELKRLNSVVHNHVKLLIIQAVEFRPNLLDDDKRQLFPFVSSIVSVFSIYVYEAKTLTDKRAMAL